MDNLSILAGLGEDPADLLTDSNPYLRILPAVLPPPQPGAGGYLDLAQRRLRTRRLTPGGLPQPPELMGVDADARVPNLLQPMAGEFNAQGEVGGGAPSFHNPEQPPSTGIASTEMAPPGPLQSAPEPVPSRWRGLLIAAVGNERQLARPPRERRQDR
jgi:hypothetical protein